MQHLDAAVACGRGRETGRRSGRRARSGGGDVERHVAVEPLVQRRVVEDGGKGRAPRELQGHPLVLQVDAALVVGQHPQQRIGFRRHRLADVGIGGVALDGEGLDRLDAVAAAQGVGGRLDQLRLTRALSGHVTGRREQRERGSWRQPAPGPHFSVDSSSVYLLS